MTLHRPSNVDDLDNLAHLIGALAEVDRDLPLVFPAHPRTRSQLTRLDGATPAFVTDPFGYLDFLDLMSGATVVLTDSGGVQEETTALGIPCLTLRDNTERPITVSDGTNQLIGSDPSGIVKAVTRTLEHPPAPRSPELWDGKAAARIIDVLNAGLPRRRPTDLA